MLTKSKMLMIAATAMVAFTSPVFAFDPARTAQWQDVQNYSQRHATRYDARARARQVRGRETIAEPFTPAEKRAFQAPDPYSHPNRY